MGLKSRNGRYRLSILYLSFQACRQSRRTHHLRRCKSPSAGRTLILEAENNASTLGYQLWRIMGHDPGPVFPLFKAMRVFVSIVLTDSSLFFWGKHLCILDAPGWCIWRSTVSTLPWMIDDVLMAGCASLYICDTECFYTYLGIGLVGAKSLTGLLCPRLWSFGCSLSSFGQLYIDGFRTP